MSSLQVDLNLTSGVLREVRTSYVCLSRVATKDSPVSRVLAPGQVGGDDWVTIRSQTRKLPYDLVHPAGFCDGIGLAGVTHDMDLLELYWRRSDVDAGTRREQAQQFLALLREGLNLKCGRELAERYVYALHGSPRLPLDERDRRR